MEVGEKELSVLEALEVDVDRLLDLDDDLGGVIDLIGRGQDGGPGCGILFVGETAAVSRPFLNEDLMAVDRQVADPGRNHSYAVLVVFDFTRHADTHVSRLLRCDARPRRAVAARILARISHSRRPARNAG